jgi:hypothetical protein
VPTPLRSVFAAFTVFTGGTGAGAGASTALRLGFRQPSMAKA